MKLAHICVICNFKQIFPSGSSECFDFITPQFIKFWLCTLSGNLNKPVFVFCQSLSYCAFYTLECNSCFIASGLVFMHGKRLHHRSQERSIIFFPDCDVLNFYFSLIFVIKRFFYMNKKSRWKLNILKYIGLSYCHFYLVISIWQGDKFKPLS